MTDKKKYLVIKHGALGDFIMATGPFQAIRKRHPKSHIVLLTGEPYAELAEQTGYFDEIWIDPKPRIWEINLGLALMKRLRNENFRMVYDLQTSDRTDWYFRLIGRKKPMWNGRINWCSHPHLNPNRTNMHTLERQADQLFITGIKYIPSPDVSWLKSDISKFNLPKPYAVIVPGGAAHRMNKRWPVDSYAELCRYLIHDKGITPVLIGTGAEEFEINQIKNLADGCVSLVNETSFADIAEIARGAKFAVGNDTGPMHIVSVTGIPTISLFSMASNPDKVRPRGPESRFIFEENLMDLPAKHVISLIEEMVTFDDVT